MFAVAGIWSIQGCMPDIVEVGRGAGGAIDPGAGGAAAGSVTDPRAGGPAVGGGGGAGGSATGGATAGAGTGGAVPRAGTGGTGGTRPDAGHGGTGGSVAGGMGGNVGRAGSGAAAGTGATGGTGITQGGSDGGAGAPFAYDESSCSCRVEGEHEFYCVINRLAKPIEPPSDCDNDLDYVHRAQPGHALTYWWSEGTENEYELVLNQGGGKYFKAMGYVGSFCGIEGPDYDLGTVEFGPPPLDTPSDTVDASECSVCEGASGIDPTPGLPACEPCSNPTDNYLNQESLADFCTFHGCPATIAEASAIVATRCPATPAQYDSTISTGCGYTRVAWIHPLAIEAYFFDTRTEALVGAEFGGDQPAGACLAATYAGGDVPTQPCADASTCTLCDYASGAAGSGSGAAGSAGTGKPPPRCP